MILCTFCFHVSNFSSVILDPLASGGRKQNQQNKKPTKTTKSPQQQKKPPQNPKESTKFPPSNRGVQKKSYVQGPYARTLLMIYWAI